MVFGGGEEEKEEEEEEEEEEEASRTGRYILALSPPLHVSFYVDIFLFFHLTSLYQSSLSPHPHKNTLTHTHTCKYLSPAVTLQTAPFPPKNDNVLTE